MGTQRVLGVLLGAALALSNELLLIFQRIGATEELIRPPL